MLEIGSKAPNFTLSDQDGNPVTLEDQLAAGPVVLYFYPADFTPGCTREACDLRDMFPCTQQAGLQVYGVSPQGPDSHRRFREEHQLPFSLLCDEDKEVARRYDCLGLLGLRVLRVTYLIGSDGTIKDAVKADFRIGRHTDLVARHLGDGKPAD